MSAFIPGLGLSLSDRNTFVTGSHAPLTTSPLHPNRTAPSIDTTTKAALPKVPTLPSFGKSAPKSNPAPAPASLSIGGKSVVASPVVKDVDTTGAYLASGIPKFYNPATSRAEFKATAKGHNATIFDCRVGRETNTTNRRINEQGTFRNMDPYTDDLVWARPGWSSQDARVAVRITLRNVLGNAHLFDSEVEELAYSISCVTLNANIKEFVRAIGLSHAYRSRFFESSSNTRFVENNFLHFLGRAPHNQQEISEHIAIINEQGYNAEINSYIDSDEYDVLFGESRIPAKNFRGGYPYDNDMNKLAVLSGGFSSSHRVVKTALLSDGDASNYSPLSILKGLPEAWCGENTARSNAGLAMEYDPDTFWVPKQLGIREAEVEWTSRYGVWTKFWYKDSAIYKSIMTPQLSHSYEEEEEAAAILKYGSNMAKSYCGVRKTFDIAPVIEITAPTNVDSNNGALRIQMEEISFSIPSELMQKV